jgi:hypothetical protein
MFPKRSDAVLQVRRRALMENSLFVKDTEIVTMMNRHTRSVYKHCLTALGADTFAERFVISGIGSEANKPTVLWPNTQKLVAGNPVVEATEFSLPTDFYRLLRCDWCQGTVQVSVQSGGTYWITGANKVDWCPMERVEIRTGVIDDTPREWASGLVGYWLKGTPGGMSFVEQSGDITTTWWIAFLPPPSLAVSVSIWYVPMAPQFSLTDDTNLIKLQDEAWEFVMNNTAAEMMEKQGRDSSARTAAAMTAKGELLTSQVGPDDENAWGTIDVGGSQVPHGRRRNVWGP